MLIHSYKKLFIIVTLFLTTACNSIVKNEEFNKSEWNVKDDFDFPNRDAMLNDLISNHQLKGLTYKQLIDSLGEPENYENKDSVYYDIVTNFGYLDPKSGKYLVLPLSKDSVVTGFKVVEWHNRHVNE